MATIDEIALEFDLIVKELEGSGKRKDGELGRPTNFTLEKYKAFLYWYLQTGMKEWSYYKSGIGKHAYETARTYSKTFQGVLKRDGDDLKAQAMLNISRDIRGLAQTVDKDGNITNPGIPGSTKVSQWFVENAKQKEEEEEEAGQPMLGAPQNEREAELMATMLNRYDQLKSKRASRKSKGDSAGSDIK